MLRRRPPNEIARHPGRSQAHSAAAQFYPARVLVEWNRFRHFLLLTSWFGGGCLRSGRALRGRRLLVRSALGVLDPVEDRLKTRWHSRLVNLDRVSSAFALDSNLVLKSVCSRLSGANYGRQ